MKRIILLLSILLLSSSSNNSGYCDIKGNVKNPGVYKIKNNYTIKDVIDDAGGLKNNSYTDNINLSKKVIDEMVIYIFNNEEISNIKNLNNCVCEPIYKYIECEIKDETKVIEPTTTIITTTKPIETITTTEIIKDEKININLCTKEELLTIDGLGEKKSNAIIKYREINGYFETIEELLKVDGIGKNTFDKIKEFIEI